VGRPRGPFRGNRRDTETHLVAVHGLTEDEAATVAAGAAASGRYVFRGIVVDYFGRPEPTHRKFRVTKEGD
jgi:hypothetical protein